MSFFRCDRGEALPGACREVRDSADAREIKYKRAPGHLAVDPSVCFTGKFEAGDVVLLDALAHCVRIDCHHVLQVLQHFRMFPVPRRRPDDSHERLDPVEMPCEHRNTVLTFRVAIELEYLSLRCQRPELNR